MIKRSLASVILFICFCFITYSQEAYIPPDRPKLVIGIIVEQLRFDQIEKFRDRFSDNGIKRLLNEGTFYRNAEYDYILTQSAPGFATISTGAEPAFHGITSDSWYLPLRNEQIYCTKDISVNPVGGSYESGLHSPANLVASTFSDELKMSTNRKAKVFAVGIKESAAILGAGHAADGAFWFDNVSGTWMTSSYYMQNLPSWVNDFNAARHPEKYLNSIWNLFKPVGYYSACLPDTNRHESGFGGINFFPYDLRKIAQKSERKQDRDFSMLRETPFSDALTTQFVLRLIENEQLGKDEVTDYLSVCYSSTDYIGHRFGPSSVEMADAIFRIDYEIEMLLKSLNENIGKKNILVYFTSAHGVSEVPSVLESNRIPAGVFRQNQSLQLLRSYLNAVYGEGDWVKGYSEKQFFLNRTLIEDARIPLEEIQKKVARFVVQFSGVAAAYPISYFEANDFGNGNLKKILNNFSPQRSGDVIIVLNPGWIETESGYVTNHNSPYEYDIHVPLIWYGWTVDRLSVTRKVNITDIAPTLSTLCRIPFPNASTGEPMYELFR